MSSRVTRHAASAALATFAAMVAGQACGDGSGHSPEGPDGGLDPPDGGRADAAPPDGGSDAADSDSPSACGDDRRAALVYYGTQDPSFLPLTDGQLLAFGSFGSCTATIVAPRWALTARHCRVGLEDRLCIGANMETPVACYGLSEVHDHPALDLTLVRLDEEATARVPDLVPVPVSTAVLDETWIGRTAEAAGYGLTDSGESGARRFVAEPLVDLDAELMVIDGMGERGLCRGDSGGPVMLLADDGTVRVAGVLSYGDPSCTGRDTATRVALRSDWVEAFTGPMIVPDADCGSLDETGRCVDGASVYCSGGTVQREPCGDGTRCGWDEAHEAFRCISVDDPCEGVDGFGVCEDGVARWCEQGTPRERDCARCGAERCAVVAEVGGVYCEPDPCAELDSRGRCNGDVAEWCEEGIFRSLDCAARDQRCALIKGLGYFCSD